MANPETRIFCTLDGLTPAAREHERLAAVNERGLLDAQTVAVFDEATQTAARLLDAPICMLGVMGQHHLHIKSAIGLSRVGLMNQLALSRQLPRGESFCSYVVDSHQVLAIPDTGVNPVLNSSLLVWHYGIRAYLGTPLLTQDGRCLGTLAVMDWEPRSFSAKDIDVLAMTARWSLSEFERNCCFVQNKTSSVHRRPQSLPTNQAPLLWKQESTTDQETLSNDVSVYVNTTNFIKVKLLAQLTQELRTPLTSVMGMASVLTRQVYGPLTAKQQEYLEIIHRSGQQLVSLVDEIVNLGNSGEINEQLQLTSVDIEMLAQQAIISLSEIAEARQQQIRLSVEPGSRIWSLDKDKVRQILYYLVYSVIHSAEMGSEIHIHASHRGDVETGEIPSLQIAVRVSHPWLGDGLSPISQAISASLFPSSTLAVVACTSETSRDRGTVESNQLPSRAYVPPTERVLSYTSLWAALAGNSEINETVEKNSSREKLGLLLSCHLAELHRGQISIQGCLESGCRYVVTLPQLELVGKRL